LQGFASRLVLVVPSGVFLAPLAAQAWIAVGGNPERVGSKLAAVLAVTGGLIVAAQLGRGSRRLTWFFLCLPPVFLVVTSLQSIAGRTFWPAAVSLWDVMLPSAVAASVALLVRMTPIVEWNALPWRQLVVGLTLVLAVFSLAANGAKYRSAHFSLRDSSKDLQALLSDCSSIRAYKSEGVFNGNSLRYLGRRPGERPDCLVTAFLDMQEATEIREEYEVLKTYSIFAAPEYCARARSRSEQLDDLAESFDPTCRVIVTAHRHRGSTGSQGRSR
jgi:hypothetical protein